MWVYVAAALVAVAIGFTSGWKVRDWKAGSDTAARLVAENKDALKRTEHAQNAATNYEKVKVQQRTNTVYLTREVERELKADVDCSARDIPAGLRDALYSAATGIDQPIPDLPLPAASAASAARVGGSGNRLRLDAIGVGGLLSPPEGTR